MRSPQHELPLLAALQACGQRPHSAFYTPGHKQGQGASEPLTALLGRAALQVDLPELPDLDNLFAPEGVIQQAQELAADAFGAERTWFLANGSTCGIEAAILATCLPGEKIILPRNAHQSAIAALILSGAVPIFVNPDYDARWEIAHSIAPAMVAQALEQHPDAKAVLMVYPTYYGVAGDVQAIAHLAHQHGIPLLVDEAHGAHFAFHPELPIAALRAGADLVVQSTHKVLGAMTQAAMLHVQGNRISRDRISRALQLVQSTSPSYVLLASLDAARQQMALNGHELMTQSLSLADTARTQLQQIPGLAVLDETLASSSPGFHALDRTRLTVDVTNLGLTGFAADEILHEQLGVTAELPSLHHLTFIISLGNTPQDIDRLIHAFCTLAKADSEFKIQNSKFKTQNSATPQPPSPSPQHLTPRDAFLAPSESVAIAQAPGRISAALVCPYPPGIPVLLPGEVITAEAVSYLQAVVALGGIVTGCGDALQTLEVVKYSATRLD
jgi:arginine decarboxylase